MQGRLSFGATPALDLPWDLPPPPQVPPALEDAFKGPQHLSGETGNLTHQPVSNPFVQNGSAIADFGEVNLALEALPLNLPPPPQRPPPLWQASKAVLPADSCDGHTDTASPGNGHCSRPCLRSPAIPIPSWGSQANVHEQDWEHKAREFFNASILQNEKPEFDAGMLRQWGDSIEGLADVSPPSPLSSQCNQAHAVESKIFGEWQLQAREALINETLDDINFVQESYAAAERDLEWRKATSMSKRQQIETRQAELAVFQRRVQVQEKDVVADEELIRCREAQLDADAQHLRRCENALKAEAKRVKQRRDDLDNSEPMLQRKEEELVRMQEELSKLEKEVSEAEQDIQHRSADIAAAEAQLRRRRAELSSRHAEVAGDRRVLNSREAELLHQGPCGSRASPEERQMGQLPVAAAVEASAAVLPASPAPVLPAPVQMQPQAIAPCQAAQSMVQQPMMLAAPPPAVPPAMPAMTDPVQQNLAMQLQQTQQMLQMQQMQQLQHFMKGGLAGSDDSKEKDREKLKALEDTVLERLEALEKHEAALTAVMAAAAQAAKETQEATAAIVKQSTEAAKETAAAIMAKSSEVVRSAVQDMTEALAGREQETLQAMSAMPVHVPASSTPIPQQALQPTHAAPGAPKLADSPMMSVACNTDRLDPPETSYTEDEVETRMSQARQSAAKPADNVRPEPDQVDPQAWHGQDRSSYQRPLNVDQVYNALQGQQASWVRPMGARRAALREGYGIEDVQALASTAALLRGEQPQLGGERDDGELWCGESDIAARSDDEQVYSAAVGRTEGSSLMLNDQMISRSSIVERDVAEAAFDESESELNSPSPPSTSAHLASKPPPVAWEISLTDWPRTPSQMPSGQTSADVGRQRMQKAQEAARRKVEGVQSRSSSRKHDKAKNAKDTGHHLRPEDWPFGSRP